MSCDCGGSCGGGDNNHSHEEEELVNLAFAMDKEFMNEINEAAQANKLSFEEFVYSCIEIGIELTNGNIALIDPETGERVE
ncbi:hypothetical protein [Limisalsivibrio acetivorans]|uniref:hypothetical protein n=1 Tax=Limisalsivibrio acetivorans TaxID=1304888 RepID=UPI0003B5A17F|nr:hypothetical protein [Limisalsivibrio acetivorans]